MKGKYANAAERRRAMEALERRATEAERAREKAETTLSTQSEAMTTEIAGLKKNLRSVTAERNAGQGPEVAKLQAQNEDLREKLEVVRERNKSDLELWRGFSAGFFQYLIKVDGLTDLEAKEVMLNFLPGKDQATRITGIKAHSGMDQTAAQRIEAAQGKRHANDVLSMALEALKAPLDAVVKKAL